MHVHLLRFVFLKNLKKEISSHRFKRVFRETFSANFSLTWGNYSTNPSFKLRNPETQTPKDER